MCGIQRLLRKRGWLELRINQVLAGWVMAAGIQKRVTFHVGRHTNATLLLSLEVAIETVSKLVGHSDIKK